MYKTLAPVILCCTLYGCIQTNTKSTTLKADTSVTRNTTRVQQAPPTTTGAVQHNSKGETSGEIDTALYTRLRWIDSASEKYIQQSENELVALPRKNGAKPDWIWDGLVTKNGQTFISVNIAHEGEHGFTHDAWIYIDTATRQVYEYDVANEKLNKWGGRPN